MIKTTLSSVLLLGHAFACVGCGTNPNPAVVNGETIPKQETDVSLQTPRISPPPNGIVVDWHSMKWPLVHAYYDPNKIVYDEAYFDRHQAYYENLPIMCGIGPECKLTAGDASTVFRSDIASSHIGNRFHIDHLRKFLRSRIDNTTTVFRDKRALKLSPFERDVYYCVSLVRHAGAKEALPELTSLLSDRSKAVRQETIAAIGSFGEHGRDSVRELGKLLETDMVNSASCALANVGSSAVPVLTEKALTGGTDARIFSIEALGKIGPAASPAVDVLIKCLYEKKDSMDRPGYISQYAATALGRIGDKRALPHLRHIALSKNHQIRNASLAAIREIESLPETTGNCVPF